MFARPIDFANYQCDRYYLHRLNEEVLGLLNHLVLCYLNSNLGQCWVFYNSDVKIFDDEGRYNYRYQGEFLDPAKLTVFVRDNYSYWERRLKCPGLTQEERSTLLKTVREFLESRRARLAHEEFHLALWAILLWHASPYSPAITWRCATFPAYRLGSQGNFVEYNGKFILLDDIEMLERQHLKCERCGEKRPCISLADKALCAACVGSNQCHACTHICKHNGSTIANNGLEKDRFPFLTRRPKEQLALKEA